ncbi:MAG: AraC family transcriptional regulator [Pseudomonadota bacterium]
MTIALFAASHFSFAESLFAEGGSRSIATGESVSLIFVGMGRASVCNDGRYTDLRPRECGLYISNRQTEICAAEEGASVLCCTAQRAGSFVFREMVESSSVSHKPESERIGTLLKVGCELTLATSAADITLRDTIGEASFQAFFAETGFVCSSQIPEFIRRARAYVDEHFAEEVPLSRLAVSACVTKEHLVAAFRRHLGVTPIRYLWGIRTRKAVELVQTTLLPLAEIAQLSGFKSQYHLSREIKRVTGVSPRELRGRSRCEIAAAS